MQSRQLRMRGTENVGGKSPQEQGIGALEQFPLLMAALKEELRRELLEELHQGEWLDQEHSVLGRNIHVQACQRLIRKNSPDAYFNSTDGLWYLRARAVDLEIQRRNRKQAEKLPAPQHAPVPVEPLPLAKTGPESDDETGVYKREWIEKLRGGR